MEQRARIVFEEILRGFDGITFMSALHSWKDEDALKYLGRRNALDVGEKVFIVDVLVKNRRKFMKDEAYLDVVMIAMLNGLERTKKEMRKLLDESDLE
jgi:hypothetical protein